MFDSVSSFSPLFWYWWMFHFTSEKGRIFDEKCQLFCKLFARGTWNHTQVSVSGHTVRKNRVKIVVGISRFLHDRLLSDSQCHVLTSNTSLNEGAFVLEIGGNVRFFAVNVDNLVMFSFLPDS